MTKTDGRKKIALARKREAESWTSAVGRSLHDPMSSIGVVIEHPGLSQCNYFLFRSMNVFSRDSLGVDVALFVLQQCPAMTTLTFPMMDSHDLADWDQPLIAVGTTSCLEGLRSRSRRIIHYVFEIDFLDRRDLATHAIQRAFCDRRVQLMTRGNDYRQLIEAEFGKRLLHPFVPDCEFAPLVRAALGGE